NRDLECRWFPFDNCSETAENPGRKRKKQVRAETSTERDQYATVMSCMSPNNNVISPALIFAGKKMKKELSYGLINESGWMTGELFFQWLTHSNYKHVDALSYAKETGRVMLSFPPHCIHRLQSLSVTLFAALKTFYNQKVSKWPRTHPARVVTPYEIATFFSEAYGKAATNQNAVSGFVKTVIWPLNLDVFPDYVFCAVAVTDKKGNTKDEGVDVEKDANAALVMLEQSCSLPTPSYLQSALNLQKHS
ncbi:hypothetical protein ILUMI_08041, partial [Ignelater luminosus]